MQQEESERGEVKLAWLGLSLEWVYSGRTEVAMNGLVRLG